jgi:hypothetical protein
MQFGTSVENGVRHQLGDQERNGVDHILGALGNELASELARACCTRRFGWQVDRDHSREMLQTSSTSS